MSHSSNNSNETLQSRIIFQIKYSKLIDCRVIKRIQIDRNEEIALKL